MTTPDKAPDARTAAVPDGGRRAPRRLPIMGVMLAAAFVSLLNQTLLIVAIPPIMNEFGIQPNQAQWITTAFMLTNGIMIPVTAFLIEKFGSRSLLLFALGVFCAGTLLGALAPNFAVLLLARITQAMGAGILMPLMQTVTLILFPPEKRGAAMGMVGLVIGFAPAIGPTLGGWIIGHGTWRYLFYTVLPITLLVLAAAFVLMKNVIDRKPRAVDPVSIALSTAGWGGLLYGFSMIGSAGWGDAGVLAALMAGAVALVFFIRRQLAMDEPMLNFRVFRYPVFTLTTALAVLMFAVLIGTETLLPMYVQNVRGGSALQSGLMLLPGALATGLLAPVAGRLYDRFGARGLSITGFAFMVAGTMMLLNIGLDTGFVLIAAMFLIQMTGVALLMTPLMTAGINALPFAWIPHGTAMSNTIRMAGASIGTAVMVSAMSTAAGLAENRAADPAFAGLTGIKAGIAAAAVMVLAGLVASFFLREKMRRELAAE
jgi:EmrB/QacA subfamily drug resistance transporter